VTNRIANHLPQPEPDPEKNGGGEPDLTKGELPKLPKDAADDEAKPPPPDASIEKGGGTTETPEPTVSERLRDIRGRQDRAAAEGRRAQLSPDEIDLLVHVANRYREQEQVDQSKAPPVDWELMRRHVAKELPEELDVLVIDLCMRYDNWNEAAIQEGLKQIAAERNAENN
jgi:hypothetical protein